MQRVYLLLVCWSIAGIFSTSPEASEPTKNPCYQAQDDDLPPEKDLGKLMPETLLASYLRVDTTNPPGCEGKAARFWKKFFDRYAIESEIIPLPFGNDRANIIAKVRGTASGQRPIVLLNHMDVVPAEPSRWRDPPFAGVIRGGLIFGRGTFDMKATAVYQALMLAKAKTETWKMHRDLIFLGTANEEGPFDPSQGVISGAEWMLKYRFEDLNHAEYVITEGGYIPTQKGRPVRWEVSPGEKARLEVTFKVSDDVADPSAQRLVVAQAVASLWSSFKPKAVEPLPRQKQKTMQDPILRAESHTTHALTTLGGVGKGNTIAGQALSRLILRGFPKTTSQSQIISSIRKQLPQRVVVADAEWKNNDLYMTLKSRGDAGHASLPPLDGGAGVILAQAVLELERAVKARKTPAVSLEVQSFAAISDEATPETTEFVFDFRLLPGDSRDAVLAQVGQLMLGRPLKFKVTDEPVIADASPINTPLLEAIKRANVMVHPKQKSRPPVETPILNSTTDAAYFRQRGMIVYGFEPIMLDPNNEHSHGDNEHISVASMRFATRVTELYLKDFLGRR